MHLFDENLELMYDGFSELPGFIAVKQMDFTLVLKILILVLLEFVVDLQNVLSVPNAPRSFLILSATSLSAPPLSLLIMLSR